MSKNRPIMMGLV